MKLPIRKKYFDMIKNNEKAYDFRDSHITFICEETGETFRKNVLNVLMVQKSNLSDELKNSDMFEDEQLIAFRLC